MASPYHWGLSSTYLHPPNQCDQIQPPTEPAPPSAAPSQYINLNTDTVSTCPALTNFVLAPSLSLQHLYPPNVVRRSGTNLLSNPTTNLYELPNHLLLQYFFPPNEALQQFRSNYMPPKHDTSLLKTKTQQYAYHPTNCSLSPQYLHPPNSAHTCCV